MVSLQKIEIQLLHLQLFHLKWVVWWLEIEIQLLNLQLLHHKSVYNRWSIGLVGWLTKVLKRYKKLEEVGKIFIFGQVWPENGAHAHT